MEHLIKFKEVVFWTDQNEILYCRPLKLKYVHKLELDKVKKYIDAIVQITNGKSMPFLIDLRDVQGTFSVLAAKELSNNIKLAQIRQSEVFVVNSINMKLLTLSYKRLFNPDTPYMLFHDIELAKNYCKQMKSELYGSI